MTEAYRNPANRVEVRARDLLSKMTLEEKIAQMTSVWMGDLGEKLRSVEELKPMLRAGIGQLTRVAGTKPVEPAEGAALANELQRFLIEETRLGIPAMVHEECLAGLMAHRATSFPQAISLGCSFEPELVERITTRIREQMRAVGAHQGLAPVLDVARDARWGRIEETFGEDPYLVSRMGTAYVRGLQGEDPARGVLATLKHFAGYSFSEGGRNLAPAHIGPRELRDLFLYPFEVAIREGGAASVMNAYQDIDGVPAAASRELLTGVLREEWGFEGLVVADYFAIEFLKTLHHVAEDERGAAVLAVKAGIDIELPHRKCYAEPLHAAVQEGDLSEAAIDTVVLRILGWKFRLGLFESPYVDPQAAAEAFDTPADRELAREAARRSIVLLRNEGDLLPLTDAVGSIAVIGPNADRGKALFGDYHFTNQLRLEEPSVATQTLLEAIRDHLHEDITLHFAQGCAVEDLSREGFEQAVEAARASDVAIVVLGDQSGVFQGTVGENCDSDHLRFPGVQEELLRAVYDTGTPTVLVLLNGRPYAMEWAAEHVPAIVEAWFPGEEGAQAVAEVLFGDQNPSGKLCVTIPRRAGHEPLAYNGKVLSRKDYVTSRIAPLFAFGHGLSYTTFDYGDLAIEPDSVPADGTVEVRFTIRNVGERAGEEIVQLYVRDRVASCTRPVRELKGFGRVALDPQEQKTVRFLLPTDLLAFRNPELQLVVEPGEFELWIGSSSEDLRLHGRFQVEGSVREIQGRRRYETKIFIES